MFGHRWARALAVLGLLLAVGAIATVAYNAGTMHAGGGVAAMGYGRGGFGHEGYGRGGGFFVFRLLFGFFAVVLLLKLFRLALFGPRQWSGGWRGGSVGQGGWGWSGRRARLEEWHREAHAQPSVDAPHDVAAPDTAGDPSPVS